ncbi:MAG: threonine synthase [Candidatus Hydrogenedentes bacterium]|nr:threonine synthase [Candidatus Hydrogenedentota bacterium]
MDAYLKHNGVINHYRQYLPVTDATPVITLNEGNTPLIQADNLSRAIDERLDIYLKYEGLNPTGSFKDRGMTMAVSKAIEDGAKAVMCASTGNTSASAAAYSAKAGIKCVVLIPEGAIALGKLSQALIHNAQVLAVDGNFDDALRLVRSITDNYPITLVNSINPYRIEGQKTGAFEIVDSLGDAPDFHAIPVGNAGNITAYWKGYREYRDAGKSDNLPRMIGFQAAGSAPIVAGHPIEKPETFATAIRIGNPASWKQAEQAAADSTGGIWAVTDDEIREAYKMLAATEGIFAEPASAASVAGVRKLVKEGFFDSVTPRDGEKIRIVCILTGHGLKDPDAAIRSVKEPVRLPADESVVIETIGL